MQNLTNPLDVLVERLLNIDTLRVGVRELRDGEVVFVADSRLNAELFGATPEQTRGRTGHELGLPPSVIDACTALIASAVETERPTTGTIVCTAADRARDLQCTVVPVPGSTRQLVFVEEARAACEPVVAALVHELGNPLLAVTANIDVALRRLERGAGSADVIDAVADARTAAGQACDVLATMRALSYPSETSVTTPVRELIEAAIAALPDAEAPRVVVDGELPDREVVTGRSAARQIVVNLMRNAIEASGGGAAVRVSARLDGERAIVAIRDDGAGIDPELAPRLFTAFATGRRGGTGLGLFISRALAERIGARVEVRNRDDAAGAVAEVALRVAA